MRQSLHYELRSASCEEASRERSELNSLSGRIAFEQSEREEDDRDGGGSDVVLDVAGPASRANLHISTHDILNKLTDLQRWNV